MDVNNSANLAEMANEGGMQAEQTRLMSGGLLPIQFGNVRNEPPSSSIVGPKKIKVQRVRRTQKPVWLKQLDPHKRMGVEKTEYQKQLEALGIEEKDIEGNRQMRLWIRTHADRKFVPESVLRSLGITVHADSFGF